MIYQGMTYTTVTQMVTVECCNCGVLFGMPSDLNDRFANDPEQWFHCPHGHKQHYQESREKRLRREAELKLQRKENELAQAQTKAIQLETQLSKANRKLKRVSNGVCPCCNRAFEDLARHMKTKHPEAVNKKQP